MDRFRNFAICFSFMLSISTPSIEIDPASFFISVPMICNRVVFPAPLAPTTATISPFFISNEIPFNTCRSPKALWMSVAMIIQQK